MAVAMEVSWRGGEPGSPVRKKIRAWGADAQQLMQLMMGQQLHSQPAGKPELTLALRNNADPSSSCVTQLSCPPDFDLHLHPQHPLPSGWEKCLDLQTGKVFYVNHASGVSSFDDPRKRVIPCQGEEELPTLLAHEFLGSKESETLKACSPSSSGSSQPSSRDPFHAFSTGKHLWSLQLHDRRGAGSSPRVGSEEDASLELDLNLAAGGRTSFPSRRPHEQTVCTMEMIQDALRRTSGSNSRVTLKRGSTPRLRHKQHSTSSSFSSLTNSTGSEPSGASPSTSSSSSASSTSSLPGAARRAPSYPSPTGVCTEAESIGVESAVDRGALVMGACIRCLSYVMLNQADPRCPRCEREVPVDFSTGPPCKKQRGGPR